MTVAQAQAQCKAAKAEYDRRAAEAAAMTYEELEARCAVDDEFCNTWWDERIEAEDNLLMACRDSVKRNRFWQSTSEAVKRDVEAIYALALHNYEPAIRAQLIEWSLAAAL